MLLNRHFSVCAKSLYILLIISGLFLGCSQQKIAPGRASTGLGVPAQSTTISNVTTEIKTGDRFGEEKTVAHIVATLWAGEEMDTNDLPAPFLSKGVGVYVDLRSDGVRIFHGWGIATTNAAALKAVLEEGRLYLGEKSKQVDTIVFGFTHSYRPINPINWGQRIYANVHRGRLGIELTYQDQTVRYAPIYVTSTNRSHDDLLNLFQTEHTLNRQQMNHNVGYRMFESHEVLVKLGSTPEALFMERGNIFVPLSDVTQTNIKRTADLAITWLTNNVHEDGRMTYLYWPSASTEAAGRNNMIRQWMATVALGRAAAFKKDTSIWQLAERNINYNLDQFYREENGLGFILNWGKAKLGAAALAALAILEHPQRKQWQQEEAALQRMIHYLWNKDGSFETFYMPSERDDNQNFYPGEALLYWANLYQVEPNQKLLDRFMKSFEYYRSWHLNPENRDPAFIPWHTQAYYIMWQETHNEQLKNFIFKMNDWLLSMQQREEDVVYENNVVYPELIGRFYNPDKPYGAPHASSTGVYLEGLIAAYRLAVDVGDEARAQAYRETIRYGLRSVMQLQFEGPADLFYTGQENLPYVLGGIRTTVYDNQIRCDNVQHNLMALLKIINTFGPQDYKE